MVLSKENKKASECIECGKCVGYCTQKINIPEELKKVSMVFDKPQQQ